ncbi:hypothetical protein OB919_16105 [Halobacteria archaeon AArc-curdl1]|uniref:Uncharacterized protein n=1 Tax=Natronosalvus hydrolyticus TaxID=2979988 RepID=A0AAP3E8Q7_9EURY|nr:hypothetical protein [Halobacteria archaeon AArc-curdl1]
MESDGEILEEPQRFEDKGLAVRLIYVKERYKYRVEYSPLLKNGEIEGNWGVFGGSVGYTCSEYNTEEEARQFYNKLEEIPADEILDHFAVGEKQ